jgi:hypothetical protein
LRKEQGKYGYHDKKLDQPLPTGAIGDFAGTKTQNGERKARRKMAE